MMKKLYTFLCICGLLLSGSLSIQAAAPADAAAQASASTQADAGRILLQHQGIIAHSFAPADMAKAMEQAAEGDTLWLTNGTYPSQFTISKSVSIIGADATYINCQGSNDCITLKSASTDSLKVNLENLNATSTNGLRIEIYNNMEDGNYYSLSHPVKLSLYKSRILEIRSSHGTYAKANISCNRCLITYLTALREPAQALLTNCEVMNLGDCDNIQANHCYIKNLQQIDQSMITNSIIGTISSKDFDGNEGSGTASSVITNSLYNSTDQVYALQNCILIKEPLLGNTLPFSCKFTHDQLVANSYLGNDGTVVGILGGSVPSNITDEATLLSPANRPQISNASVSWEENQKKVKVNAKVTAK